MSGPTIATAAGDLDAAWLSGLLDTEVTAVACTPVGTGQVAATFRLTPTYAPGATGPASVVVKVASRDERSRAAAAMVRAYEIEVEVYRQLMPLPGVPGCRYAARDPETNEFSVVLDDLAPCRAGDDIAGCDAQTAAAALRVLARLHAATWDRPKLADLAWLNRQTPDRVAMLTGLIGALAPTFLERFAARIAPEHRALVEGMLPQLAALMAASDGPHALVHGDFRLDNMLFRDGASEPWVVDWQTAIWGPPATDVAYFLGGSLLPADRRQHSAALLDTYHAELVAAGVEELSREQLQADVRRYALGGVVMAVVSAVLVEQTDRGDALFVESFARHAQHALDLDALGGLPQVRDTSHVVTAADDTDRHAAGTEPLWNESWYADVVSADGSVAAYVRLGLYPNLGQAWWHAVVVGPGRPLVLTSVTDLPVPDGTVVHGAGIDITLSVDEALQTFRVHGTMAGVQHDDPADVYTGEPGTPTSVEIDATWRTAGVPYHYGMTTRYEIPCAVEGHVVVDGEKLTLDGPGQRDHSWGVRDWWTFGWCWSAGHLEDGTHVHLTDVRLDPGRFAAGYVQRAGEVLAVTSGSVTESPGAFPAIATLVAGDLRVEVEPLHWGPILLTGPGGETGRFPRAAARFTTADGRQGSGWIEWNQPG